MKILHTADWHIGQFKGPVVDGVNLRSQDTVNCLNYMIKVAEEEKPDIVCVWTALGRSIGRVLNKEVMDKIEEGNAKNARYRIIRFNDEVKHDVKHTEEHFDQIIEDIDTYENYCSDHPHFPNGKAVHSISNIRKIYDKCSDEHSFL